MGRGRKKKYCQFDLGTYDYIFAKGYPRQNNKIKKKEITCNLKQVVSVLIYN